jgi:ketosteroid isomerase-like protein
VSAEENMALARRFLEARIKGDLAAVDAMMASNYVSHTKLLPSQAPDRESVKRAAAQTSAAVSNNSVLVEDQVAAADKVVTRFIVQATHDRGELMGVAPTGKEMSDMAVTIHRISGGQDRRRVEHGNDRLNDEGPTSRAREDRARTHRARA